MNQTLSQRRNPEENPCPGSESLQEPPVPALADATYITQVTAWYWGTTTNIHSVLSLGQSLWQWLHLQKCSCSSALILVFLLCRFRRSQVLHPLPCRGECCCFPL